MAIKRPDTDVLSVWELKKKVKKLERDHKRLRECVEDFARLSPCLHSMNIPLVSTTIHSARRLLRQMDKDGDRIYMRIER